PLPVPTSTTNGRPRPSLATNSTSGVYKKRSCLSRFSPRPPGTPATSPDTKLADGFRVRAVSISTVPGRPSDAEPRSGRRGARTACCVPDEGFQVADCRLHRQAGVVGYQSPAARCGRYSPGAEAVSLLGARICEHLLSTHFLAVVL